MERAVRLLFLCATIESLVVKRHYFISVPMDWYKAQAYCRQHYTDLSSVGSQRELEDLRTAAGENWQTGWIGLDRDADNVTGWRWSAGGYPTYTNWERGQPDNVRGYPASGGILPNGKWHDYLSFLAIPFYCVHLNVLEEVRKSWEEALEHCRENHSDLISLPSDTDILHGQRMVERVFADRVWVGLRHLGDGWLWLSGDPVENHAWSTGAHQDHQCPVWSRCGALSKEGLWEARDCQERLKFICF